MTEDIIGEIDSSNIDEKIAQFRKVTIDEQYKVLCDVASEGYSNNKRWLFSNNWVNNKEHGIGIIDILNYKFPEGIENLKDINSIEIPKELYFNLTSYQPYNYENKKDGWVQLIENTNIFKDKNGEIDKNKIDEYLSNPDVRVNNYSTIFKYLDLNEDRKKIIQIIEGRLQSDAIRLKTSTPNLTIVKGFKEACTYIEKKQKGNEKNSASQEISLHELIKEALSVKVDITKSNIGYKGYYFIELIQFMYESYEKTTREKYNEKEMSDDAIKGSFATCILSSYKSISEKALIESENLIYSIEEKENPVVDMAKEIDNGGEKDDRSSV